MADFIDRNRKIVERSTAITFAKFLLKVDKTSEYNLKKIMGKEYIDTPGNYRGEKRYYSNIIEYCTMNMGKGEINQLRKWHHFNPIKVKKIMKLR